LRIANLAADLEAEYEAKGRRSTSTLKSRLAHLRNYFGKRHALSITTADVNKYIASRLEGYASSSTVRAELSKLKRMYNLALQSERLHRRPYIPLPREADPRKGFFEAEQFVQVLSRLPNYLKPVVEFGYHTGWRREEITSVRWEQVDLSARVVRLWAGTTKNDQGRLLPLEGELWRIVEDQRADRPEDCPWVFHRGGQRIVTFYRAWRQACEGAGCPGMLFHDLRRTAARNFRRAGLAEGEAMALGGWKTPSVFRRYDIVSESDLRDVAWRAQAFAAESLPKTCQQGQAVPLADKPNGGHPLEKQVR
jgi:integrase